MLILGIESSCDETGAAIIKAESKNKKVKLLGNSLASSLVLHAKSGGIIPENAAREQIKYIIPVIKEVLLKAKIKPRELDAIAVTYGPGLIGSLLIGVETAKTLSYVWSKPLIPVNHLYGHIYANFIEQKSIINHQSSIIQFPAIALIVSGGHTDIVLLQSHGSLRWLGGTRDDAAGEAMDKIGRLLGLPYPGGPYIEKAALKGNPKKYNFPSPLINSKDYDFSFSGLKTAVYREIQTNQPLNHSAINDISASVQEAIIAVLVKKTLQAAGEYNAKSILLGGGVAANSSLREALNFKLSTLNSGAQLFVPTKSLCTDNGAMIAAAAFYNDHSTDFRKIEANPNLYFDTAL